jgi:hypothetical protein
MNPHALKWAAIGAGAWLLYYYITKPDYSKLPANQNPDYKYNTGNPNAPVGEELNKISGYKINIPLGH